MGEIKTWCENYPEPPKKRHFRSRMRDVDDEDDADGKDSDRMMLYKPNSPPMVSSRQVYHQDVRGNNSQEINGMPSSQEGWSTTGQLMVKMAGLLDSQDTVDGYDSEDDPESIIGKAAIIHWQSDKKYDGIICDYDKETR